MTEAGVARRCLGAGVRDEVLVLITPVLPRRRRRLSGHRGGPASGSIASAAPARRARWAFGCVVSQAFRADRAPAVKPRL